ncbi:MAG: hypothetical protein RI894_2311, partial [Bacteroidota bacterium]
KQIIFFLLKKVSRFLPLLPPKDARHRVLLPFYHAISNDKLPHIDALYRTKNTAEFEADLDFLLSIARPIDLETLIYHTKNNIDFTENVFHLTFDDGFREIYEVVAPILRRKKIPATFFINSDFIDNKNLMFRNKVSLLLQKNADSFVRNFRHKDTPRIDALLEKNGINLSNFLEKQQPYLTVKQIQKLHDQGFTFGAHSLNHPEYRYITYEEQLQQTTDSMAFIQEVTGSNLRVFSFPFTDTGVSKTFFETMQFDISFGCAGVKDDTAPQHWQRVALENNGIASARAIFALEYLYYHLRKLTKRAIIERCDIL